MMNECTLFLCVWMVQLEAEFKNCSRLPKRVLDISGKETSPPTRGGQQGPLPKGERAQAETPNAWDGTIVM
ncbi:hypothetical protein AVEN_211633-1, partial [Araneus ventricosus]